MSARGRARLLERLDAARGVPEACGRRPQLIRGAHALVSSAVVIGDADLSRACVALPSAAAAPALAAMRRAFLAEVGHCLAAETGGGRG